MHLPIRLTAVALLAAAIFPWWPAAHERLLIVALDGVRGGAIESLCRQGELPNLARLMTVAVHGRLVGRAGGDPREFWRAALRDDGGGTWRSDDVWNLTAAAGVPTAVVGVPETDEVVSDKLVVAPGADEVEGFIGLNEGRVVDLDVRAARGVGWPYTAEPQTAVRKAAALAVGQASDWTSVRLDAPDRREGVYRAYRASEASVYLTPVYRSGRPARTYVASAPRELLYVPDDPSWAFTPAASVDIFRRHARDLSAARFEVALRLAAERRRLIVYFDPLIAVVAQAGAPRAGSEALRAAYRTLDERIGELLRAMGSRSVIVVLGREPSRLDGDDSAERGATGFFLVAYAARSQAALPAVAEVSSIAPTLLHLSDLTPDRGRPVREVAARFPRRGHDAQPRRHATARGGGGVPLTSESLQALGLLSQSTQAPASSQAAASAR